MNASSLTTRFLVSAEHERGDYRLSVFLTRSVALSYADRMADLGFRIIVTTVA